MHRSENSEKGLIDMDELSTHTDSIEFGLAQFMWEKANDVASRQKAIELYEISCKKNDGAAFLALYKINIEWFDRPLNHYDKLRINLNYLYQSMRLGYLPAFLYAATLEIFSKYEKLTYISYGMSFAHQKKSELLKNFQRIFIEISSTFAEEFRNEIIENSQKWTPGEPVEIYSSSLEGLFINHPKKYSPENNLNKNEWYIFLKSTDTEKYLRQLPGSDEYFKACYFEENEDLITWKKYMEISESKGNGQAIYANNNKKSESVLLRAAQNGSIDALIDLTDYLNNYFNMGQYHSDFEYEFYNSDRIITNRSDEFNLAIYCLLYLFTIMERLGIEKYFDCDIKAARLTTENESGYQFWDSTSVTDIKYELCSHDLINEVNQNALQWKLGKDFHSTFLYNFKIILKSIDKIEDI